MDRFPNQALLIPIERTAGSAPPVRVALLRSALIAGAMAAIAVASAVASGASEPVDQDLMRLLRGMAAVKGVLALGAAVAVGWRLGRPVAWPMAGAYLVGVWALFAATGLIWHAAMVPLAAVLFHAAGLGVVVVSMRDGIGSSIRRWWR